MDEWERIRSIKCKFDSVFNFEIWNLFNLLIKLMEVRGVGVFICYFIFVIMVF